MDRSLIDHKTEKSLVAPYVARLGTLATPSDFLEAGPNEDLPLPKNLIGFLNDRGYRVSEPHNYPEGIRIELTRASDAEGSEIFRGETLRVTLLKAIEWSLSIESTE